MPREPGAPHSEGRVSVRALAAVQQGHTGRQAGGRGEETAPSSRPGT